MVAGADGGGPELLFVPMPDAGPLQHKSSTSLISISSQAPASNEQPPLSNSAPQVRRWSFPREEKLLTPRISHAL